MAQIIAFPSPPRPSIAAPASRRRQRESDPAAVTLWELCPWSERLSDYDKRHMPLYARLLDDELEGTSEDDMARDVFGLKDTGAIQKARLIVRSHLRRAHWVSDTLFPLLGL